MWLLVKRNEMKYSLIQIWIKCKGEDNYYKLWVGTVSHLWK